MIHTSLSQFLPLELDPKALGNGSNRLFQIFSIYIKCTKRQEGSNKKDDKPFNAPFLLPAENNGKDYVSDEQNSMGIPHIQIGFPNVGHIL